MKRRPEPELMDSEAQTVAYAEADFDEANTLFTEHFLQKFAELAPRGAMADLGCGPGDITIRLARALPDWSVTGFDAGTNMLQRARERLAAESDAPPIAFRQAYLPDPSLPRGAWDAVVSNSLLHHLPDPMTLWEAIAQMAAPGAAVQVMDLSRPDSEDHALRLVDQYAADAPDILREDFYNSLLAAYTPAEVMEQLGRAGLGHLATGMASDRHWIVSGRLKS
jgi:trans-aconitate methyltransferase